MALTRITKGVIKPNENYDTHNINSTGIVTAIGLDVNGNGDISGNLSVGGVLTYEDVTSIDSVGIITARDGIDCNGDLDVDGHTNLDNVSVAGVTTFAGAITAPDIITAGALLHEGDTNTLVHFSANDTIQLKTGGSSRLLINNSGLNLENGYFNTNGNRIILGDSTGATDDRIVFGNNNDCFIYHDSTNTFIENNTGILKILGNIIQLGEGDDNVGIGTNILDSSANLSITDTGSARIYLKSGNTSDTSIYFGRLNDSATAAIRYEHSTNAFDFYGYNNSKRMTIDLVGRVLIGVDTATNNDSYVQAFKPSGNDATITVGNVATSASGLCRYDFAPSNKVVGSRIECHASEDFSTSANRTADLVFITRKDGTLSEKLRIKSDGTINITTANGSLEWTASSGSNPFIRSVGSGQQSLEFNTGGDERLRITSTGTVLKGITTARQNYSNNTSGVEYGFQIESTNATKSSLSLIRSSDDANDGGIFIGKTRSASVGGNTVVQAGDDLGTITFGGADGTSLLFGAEIVAEAQSGVGNDDMPTDLIFKINGGSTTTSEKLRINSTGGLKLSNTASGNLFEYGGSTEKPNAAININRYGNGYADIRLSSNYGASLRLAGASDNTDEFNITQDNQKIAYITNEADQAINFSAGGTQVGKFNGSQGVFEVVSGDITAGYHHGNGMYGLLAKRKFRGGDALGGYAIRYASGYESPWIVGYNAGSSYDNQITFGSMTTADRNLATGVTKRMVIDMQSGNVGINETAPSEKLQVKGDVLLGSTGGDVALKFEYNNHQFAKIVGNGRDSSGYGDIDFYTSTGSGVSNLTQRMTIRADGKVGINTDDPGRMTHIFSGNTGHPLILERGDSANTQIELRTGGAIRGYWGCSTAANFLVYDNDTSHVHFTVNQTGKVGINETSPSNQLHVAGTTGTSAGGLLRLDATTGDNFILYDNTHDTTEWAVGNDSANRGNFDFWYNDGSSYNLKLRITSAGKILIGQGVTTSGLLNVKGNAVFDDGTNARITLQADGASLNQILSTTTNFGSYCNMSYQAADHIFKYGGTQNFRVMNNGKILCGVGNYTGSGYPSVLQVQGDSQLLDLNTTSSDPAIIYFYEQGAGRFRIQARASDGFKIRDTLNSSDKISIHMNGDIRLDGGTAGGHDSSLDVRQATGRPPFNIGFVDGSFYRNLGTEGPRDSDGTNNQSGRRYLHVRFRTPWNDYGMTMFRVTGYISYSDYTESYVGMYRYGNAGYRTNPYGLITHNQKRNTVVAAYNTTADPGYLVIVCDWSTDYMGLMFEHIGAGDQYGSYMDPDLEIIDSKRSTGTTDPGGWS